MPTKSNAAQRLPARDIAHRLEGDHGGAVEVAKRQAWVGTLRIARRAITVEPWRLRSDQRGQGPVLPLAEWAQRLGRWEAGEGDEDRESASIPISEPIG